MTYTFRPAALDGVGVFGCIAGTSRSGKTLTALRIARGIAGPQGKIAAIDTEGRRMSYYAAHPNEPESYGANGVFKYHFDVLDMQSPYDPLRFCDITAEAEAQGYACLVIDSFSLEWSGIGGVRDRYAQRFRDVGSKQNLSDKCWDYAKAPHKQMRDRLLQSRMPVIFCIRCNEVAKHLAGGRDGTWRMEQDQRFIYEWTFALTMHPSTPGAARYDLITPTGEDAWKMPSMFRSWFADRQFITESAGEKIQAWRTAHSADRVATRRTLREIVRDRCQSAGDEVDLAAVEALPAVQKAMVDAPDAVKAELREMLAEARGRIAKEKADAQREAAGASDDDPAGHDATDPAAALIDDFKACETAHDIEATEINPAVKAQIAKLTAADQERVRRIVDDLKSAKWAA